MVSADSLDFMGVSLKMGKGSLEISCGYSKRRGVGCFQTTSAYASPFSDNSTL